VEFSTSAVMMVLRKFQSMDFWIGTLTVLDHTARWPRPVMLADDAGGCSPISGEVGREGRGCGAPVWTSSGCFRSYLMSPVPVSSLGFKLLVCFLIISFFTTLHKDFDENNQSLKVCAMCSKATC
jgi:hypothetical protein